MLRFFFQRQPLPDKDTLPADYTDPYLEQLMKELGLLLDEDAAKIVELKLAEKEIK